MNDFYRPPGYYPDPNSPGMERWWDGKDWLDMWRPDVPSRQAAPSPPEA